MRYRDSKIGEENILCWGKIVIKSSKLKYKSIDNLNVWIVKNDTYERSKRKIYDFED